MAGGIGQAVVRSQARVIGQGVGGRGRAATGVLAVKCAAGGGAHTLAVHKPAERADRDAGGVVAVVGLASSAGAGNGECLGRDGVVGAYISDAIAHLVVERIYYSVSTQHVLATGPGQRAC